jgi:hypothetical protein
LAARCQEVEAIGLLRAGGPATWLALAFIAFVGFGLARPVTAAADGCRHDQCQTSGGGGGHDGNPYVVYPAPQATYVQQPAQQPAQYGGSRPPAPPSTAVPGVAQAPPPPAAVPTPRPPAKPAVTPLGIDYRPSLLAGAVLVGLGILLASGFGARRRLLHGWNGGPSDPTAP